jgi:3-deoxy-D-manno-octulosonic-acid transferase
LVSPFAGALIQARARRGKEDLPRRKERFGYPGSRKPNGSLIWVHAASVGETIAILPLVKRIEETGSYVVLTTGTVTSAQLAAKQIGPRTLHQYAPLDLAPFVNRFLNAWKPQLAIFVESELWPATFHALAKRGIPHVLVNARMSERSFFRWRRASGLIGAMLSNVTLCLAQTVDDAERFRVLGAPRVRVTGNLKFDTPPPADNPAQLKLFEQTLRGRKSWLASSTHPGEEAIALRVHKALKHHLPDLLTIIVPRHPERGREVAALAESEGLTHTLRSEGHLPKPETDIYIADTIGEMGLHYRVRRCPLSAAPWCAMVGRTPSNRRNCARPSCTGRTCTIFPKSTQRSIPPMRPSKWKARKFSRARSAGCWSTNLKGRNSAIRPSGPSKSLRVL